MNQNLNSAVLKQFASLGISEQESKVYIDLLRSSGRSGYNISKTTGIPSSKIYMLINRLLEQGLIVSADTHPVTYYPVPPEELISRLKSDVLETLEALEEGLNIIEKTDTNTMIAWNVTGRQDMMSRAKDMIANAQDQCFLAVWPKELRALKKEMEKAFDRGVAVRILTYGNTKFNKGEIYFHRPSDYQSREHGARRFVLTVDNTISIAANFFDNKNDTGIWTDNQGLVQLFRDLIIHEIYISKIEKAYPDEIRALVGQDWEKFRIPVLGKNK